MSIINGQLKGAQIEHVDSLPVAGKYGQVVFLTTNETIYVWKGSSWSSIVTDAYDGGFSPVSVDNTDSPVQPDVGDKGTTYLVDTSAGAITVELPAPALGYWLSFKDIGGNMSSNNLTLQRSASESIEGLAANYVCEADYGVWTIATDGVDWFLI